MSGLTCQQIVFVMSVNRSAVVAWVNAFAAYDSDRPIAFGLSCDRINADGRYNLRIRKALLFYRGEQ